MKLKALRHEAGLSQSQLAIQSGVNLRMIQKYENGDKDINKAHGITLYKLACALDCNIEDFIDTSVLEDE